jgi:predicted SAM-dependent methyltransferase
LVVGTFKSRVGSKVIPLLPFSRRTFDILRHELRAWRTRVANACSPAYRARVRRLRADRDLSVNVGSGGRGLPGWVNLDVTVHGDDTLALDIRKPLPFASESVARLLAEHVVEHVDFHSDLPAMLRDWHRILVQGGRIRIIVPDCGRFVEAYARGDAASWEALGWHPLPDDMPTRMAALNHMFHQGGEHLFGYDLETLAFALRRAGFEQVEQMAYGRSADPRLAIDQPNHAPYSLYVEAVKPSRPPVQAS